MLLRVWLIGVLSIGCLHEASETCGNGGVCPPGLLCVDTEYTTTGGQICAAGACGDGRLDPGEVCDDGNNRSGDGCPADCTQPCGDGVLDPGEACDDGNIVDGDGCSADCQTLDHKFDFAPAVVNLTAIEGDALPDAVAVDVDLELAGDSLLVGYPPGVAEPTWLSITEAAPRDHTVELTLRATDTLGVGERSTSVRLTLGHTNSTSVEALDLPVTYTVQPSDLTIQASPPSLAFTAFTADVFVPPQTIALTFDGASAAVVSAPSWLAVTRASPTTFTATVTNTHLLAGTLSDDIVFATTRDLLQRTVTVHVDYQVLPPAALALSIAPSTLTLSAITGRAPPAPLPVVMTFTGATIELVSTPPAWLTVTAPTTPGLSPAAFMFTASTTAVPAGSTSTADLVFRTVRGVQHREATVHVEYDVRFVPEIRYVAPYVGISDRDATLIIRGRGFHTGAPVTVAIGDHHIGPIDPDNDTQITVRYPPLPAGRYPVTLVDPPGIAPNSPALVIVDLPALGYQAIDAPGLWSRLVFDAERQVIYGIDPARQQLGRFAYRNGAWAALAPTIIPTLVDALMTPDGGSLIVVRDQELDEISLRDGLFTPIPRVRVPPDSNCDVLRGIAIPNHGTAFVLGCAYTYDLLDPALVPSHTPISDSIAEASGNGSTIYAHLGAVISIYDASTGTTASARFDSTVSHTSVNGDGSRAILDQKVVDRSLAILGTLPARSTPFVSRDATRAFVYAQDASGPRIDIYDLTRSIAPGAPVPLLETIALPDAACDLTRDVQVTTNLDDTVVFVAGDRRLLVVPVRP